MTPVLNISLNFFCCAAVFTHGNKSRKNDILIFNKFVFNLNNQEKSIKQRHKVFYDSYGRYNNRIRHKLNYEG